jgi:amidase
MWSIGPLARSLQDLALGYQVITEPERRDPYKPRIAVENRVAVHPARPFAMLRLAWAPTFPGVPAAASISNTLHKLASELERYGARVEERLPDINFGELAKARQTVSNAVRLAFRPEEGEPPVSLTDYFTALSKRDDMTTVWEHFFEVWDALICPVAMTTAFTHRPTGTPIEVDGSEANYWRVIGHCAPFNFTGHPSIVVPAGQDEDGLPIGVQIVGKKWGEEQLLGVAASIALITGTFKKPPGL